MHDPSVPISHYLQEQFGLLQLDRVQELVLRHVLAGRYNMATLDDVQFNLPGVEQVQSSVMRRVEETRRDAVDWTGCIECSNLSVTHLTKRVTFPYSLTAR